MRSDLVSGLFWLGIGLLLSIWSWTYQTGTLTQPGPGFLPLGLGGLVTLFSLVLIGSTLKSRELGARKTVSFLDGHWEKVLGTIVVLLVAGFFFEKVGYLLTFFFLSLLLMVMAGLRSWKQILLVAFFTALGVYLCFVLLLKQPLPTGLLGV
jgi:putative tricarboxylic transport membrane protein